MIRGPILPQAREALWSLVAPRLQMIERGLTLVAEGFDCSEGALGTAEGLARDAAGAPVVLLLAIDGDPLLSARAVAAAEFLQRVGEALAVAVPEGAFRASVPGRVLVIASSVTGALAALVQREVPGVQVCCLEPFRIGSNERFAVRWLNAAGAGAVAAPVASAPEFALPETLRSAWAAVAELCRRIDDGVRIDGDRYRRRVTWNGHVLAECWLADGGLHGAVPDTDARGWSLPVDQRAFADHVLRRYARLAGLGAPAAASPGEEGPAGQRMTTRRSVPDDGLRASAAVRLSAEEIAALAGSPPERSD